MSETNQTSTEEENEVDIKNFLTVKNFYMSYFQNIASSQAVRLIGFTAGIFTLIGAIKLSPDEHLGEFFSDVYTFRVIRSIVSIPSEIISAVNFVVFFIAISILMFFIFRAIFRYTAFSYISDTLIYITRNDVKAKNRKRESSDASKEVSLHAQILSALEMHLKENPRKVFGLSIFNFVILGNKKYRWGIFLTIILSLSSTIFLLLLIW